MRLVQEAHHKVCYAKRKQTVEPVFGQVKEQQAARRFSRRGLGACNAEWKLVCGTHNPAQAVASHPPATSSRANRDLRHGERHCPWRSYGLTPERLCRRIGGHHSIDAPVLPRPRSPLASDMQASRSSGIWCSSRG
jgi:hypothetical protein